MSIEFVVVLIEAIVAYLLVLGAHRLRHRYGLACFYALIGSLTALMVWVTDTGTAVEFMGMSLMVGSTVFYTSLMLGAFVVYVFDGPRILKMVIFTIIGLCIVIPLATLALHWQAQGSGVVANHLPPQSLRIYSSSVFATFMDFIFLAVAWEFLGKPQFRIRRWLRTFFTLLGVLWLDSLIFTTCAFAGTGDYWQILSGNLVTRLVITVLAFPFLYLYIANEAKKPGVAPPNRPVFAILKEFTTVKLELDQAQKEILRREQLEREKEELIVSLRQALKEVKTLRGILPTCAYCKDIRDDDGHWHQLEAYIQNHSHARFSHGICEACAAKHFPEYDLTIT